MGGNGGGGYGAKDWSGGGGSGGGYGGNNSAGNHSMTDIWKHGQRKSPGWKEAWAMYCQIYGNGKNDPAKHSEEFLAGFMNYLGEQGAMAMNMGMSSGYGKGRSGKSM